MIGKALSHLNWKTGVLAIAALIVLAVAAQAGNNNEVWKTKPFEQWTKADVRQILYDSPWVKREIVPEEWISKLGMQEAPSMSGGAVYANPVSGPGAQQPQGTPPGQAALIVEWTSSRTLQEALLREQILDGSVNQSDAANYLQPIPDIQITVEGADMTPFGAVSRDELMSKSVLRGKESGIQVTPTKVDLQENGGYVSSVVFTFPRRTSEGKDVASPNGKALLFTVKIKNLDLGATFDPRKMADAKGPDF
jgi:hypothetical protein